MKEEKTVAGRKQANRVRFDEEARVRNKERARGHAESELLRGLRIAVQIIDGQLCIGHCRDHGALCRACDAVKRCSHAVAVRLAQAEANADCRPDYNPDCESCRRERRKLPGASR